MPVFYLNRYGSGWIKIAMLLAKVFNKNITKKEAKKICNRVFISILHAPLKFGKVPALLIAFMPFLVFISILHAPLKFGKVPALLIAFMPFLVFIPIFSKFSNLFEFDCMFWSIANYFDKNEVEE
ncbi:hypothetical protein [uncultured Brachyspira sp.]|uniref:hypothetical protein n=1 Tax=uncultured Brachyspira sp. TaxID=221953 RepID=UPI002597D510|nr:hypothetical protein [uncultured Brachyspira sp.]